MGFAEYRWIFLIVAQTHACLCTFSNAHTDFVKALLVIPELDLLVSGGSDKDIRIHDLSSLNATWDFSSTSNKPPPFLASLREHSRPVECLKYFRNAKGETVLCSADTMGKCCLWELDKTGLKLQTKKLVEWREHETAVYDLVLEVRGIWTGKLTFLTFKWRANAPQPPPTKRSSSAPLTLTICPPFQLPHFAFHIPILSNPSFHFKP